MFSTTSCARRWTTRHIRCTFLTGVEHSAFAAALFIPPSFVGKHHHSSDASARVAPFSDKAEGVFLPLRILPHRLVVVCERLGSFLGWKKPEIGGDLFVSARCSGVFLSRRVCESVWNISLLSISPTVILLCHYVKWTS